MIRKRDSHAANLVCFSRYMLMRELCNQIYQIAPFDVVEKEKLNFCLLSVIKAATDAVNAHVYQQVLYEV